MVADYDPRSAIILQIILAALGVATLGYVLSKINLILAIWVGVFLSLDYTWVSHNLTIQTESLLISLLLLSLSILIWHYNKPQGITRWELMMSSLVYVTMVLVRPANIFLLIPILVFYAVILPRKQQLGYMLGVFILSIFGVMAYNSSQYGSASVTGGTPVLPMAFPLISQGTLLADNGEASKQIIAHLENCNVPFQSGKRYFDNPPALGIGVYFLCLQTEANGTTELSQLFFQAYQEAIIHQPLNYIRGILNELSYFLGYSSIDYGEKRLKTQSICDLSIAWQENCPNQQITYTKNTYPTKQYAQFLEKLVQPYKLLIITDVNRSSTLILGASWAVFCILLLLIASPIQRVVVLFCVVFQIYIGLSIAVAQYTTDRYSSLLSTLYLLMSAVFITRILELFFQKTILLKLKKDNGNSE